MAAGALWALAAAAAAQEVKLAESTALRCLTPAVADRGAPEYPEQSWKLGTAGRVLVELTFQHPRASPYVQVVEQEGPQDLVDAVRQHVRRFRVPCLATDDAPVRLRQEYVFRPTLRAAQAGAPQDTADVERQRMLACMQDHQASRTPDYPQEALRKEIQGRVLVQMRFESADQPPKVTVHVRPYAQVLRPSAEKWALRHRVPCHRGAPLETEATLIYRLDPSPNYGFRDITLRSFVGSIKGIRSQRVQFDFRAMACPFRLRLNYRQPALRNDVTDIDAPHEARAPFIDWLRNAELALSESQQDAVFGDSLVLDVPCGTINLSPTQPEAASPAPSAPSSSPSSSATKEKS